MKKRILICGDREWVDRQAIYSTLQSHLPAEVVIHGAGEGADTLGTEAATVLGIKVKPFPADWKRYKKDAGAIRNQQMLKEGKPTIVLAFHNDFAHSRNTRDIVIRAHKAGIPIYLNGKLLK